MKQKPNTILLLFFMAVMAGCGTLAPDGPYKSDKTLYAADKAITESYDVMHTFVLWEYRNRATLAKWPEIKKSADTVRAGAQGWIESAIRLRDVYAANPTENNKLSLDKALAILSQAIAEVSTQMAKQGGK